MAIELEPDMVNSFHETPMGAIAADKEARLEAVASQFPALEDRGEEWWGHLLSHFKGDGQPFSTTFTSTVAFSTSCSTPSKISSSRRREGVLSSTHTADSCSSSASSPFGDKRRLTPGQPEDQVRPRGAPGRAAGLAPLPPASHGPLHGDLSPAAAGPFPLSCSPRMANRN